MKCRKFKAVQVVWFNIKFYVRFQTIVLFRMCIKVGFKVVFPEKNVDTVIAINRTKHILNNTRNISFNTIERTSM